MDNTLVYPVPTHFATNQHRQPHITHFNQYKSLWEQSIHDPNQFYAKNARDLLSWTKPFTSVLEGSFSQGNVNWFQDGQLNACYNCIDRHVLVTPNKLAFIYEPDSPSTANQQHFTYKQAMDEICQLANTLKNRFHVQKGDIVGIYMPQIPQTCMAMLACARLGVAHNVIFAGFSADALRSRLIDSNCSVILTADQGLRGGKTVHLKRIVDEAIANNQTRVMHVLVFQRTGAPDMPMTVGRDVWWHDLVPAQPKECPIEPMDAESTLFILYTSGSTGKPKGLIHSTAGYLLGAAMSTKLVFDLGSEDVFACMADCGWITGHTYCVYGPLILGATSLIFESVPTFPTPSRYWSVVDKYQVTALYTAPTVIRALRRLGDSHVQSFDLKSLRVLGSVGEPINPDAWEWYYRVVGRERVPVVDTYWQTETGSHVITSIPGAIPTKPGSATLPFFGIDPVIVDPTNGHELLGSDVTGVLCFRNPWPSMARSIYNDHPRFLTTYFTLYKDLYFTGDSATRDKDGYYWIRGRVDDVINVSGHRLSTAEVESALVSHETCAEAAVIGSLDEVTGQSIIAFVTLKSTSIPIPEIPALLKAQVRQVIGPIATPKLVLVVPDLPKTRSGKIMRRILRKVYAQEDLGDTTTLADPSIVQVLIDLLKPSIVNKSSESCV